MSSGIVIWPSHLLVGGHSADVLHGVVGLVAGLQEAVGDGGGGQVGRQLLVLIVQALLHEEGLARVAQLHLYVHRGAIDFYIHLKRRVIRHKS